MLYESAGISFREGFEHGLKEGERLFKSTERKLYELGFKQVNWTKRGFVYERPSGSYIHVIWYMTNLDGCAALASYNKETNSSVGLTLKEMELFSRRIREWARSAERWFENE